MYCKNCGKQISDSAPYCNFCGATVRVSYYPNQGAGSSGAYPDSQNRAYSGSSSYAGSKADSGAYWNKDSVYAAAAAQGASQSSRNAAAQSCGRTQAGAAQQGFVNAQQSTGAQGYSGVQQSTSRDYANARQNAGAPGYAAAQQGYDQAYANVQGAAAQQGAAAAGAGYGAYVNMNARPDYGYNPGFAPVSDSGTYLKKEASSALFLAGVILFSFNALWGLIRCFFGSQIYSLIVNYFYSYFSELGLSLSTLYTFFRPLQIIEAIDALPAIAMAVGMWLLFISSKNRKSMYLNSAGFTLMKVISVIEMIFFSLAMLTCEVILVIVLVVFRSMYSGYSYYGAAVSEIRLVTVIILAAMIVIAGIAAVYIIYYAKLIAMLSSMNGAAAGRGGAKLSIYVAVIAFLGAVSAVYSGISSFSSLFIYIRYGYRMGIYYLTAVLSGIAGLCAAAAAVILGIILIKNRKKI